MLNVALPFPYIDGFTERQNGQIFVNFQALIREETAIPFPWLDGLAPDQQKRLYDDFTSVMVGNGMLPFPFISGLTTLQQKQIYDDFMAIIRAQVFDPESIPELMAWYDASDLATITSSGGAVSQWEDKSGHAFHLTQATAAKKPTTGTRTMNGLNVIIFSANDIMEYATATYPVTHYSMFVVAQSDVPMTIYRGIVSSDQDIVGSRIFQLGWTSDPKAQFGWFNTVVGPPAPSFFSLTGIEDPELPFVQAGVLTIAKEVTVYLNNVAATSNTVTGTPNSGANKVITVGAAESFGGGTFFWDGPIAEVLMYQTAVTTGQRNRVHRYLRNKWGTP